MVRWGRYTPVSMRRKTQARERDVSTVAGGKSLRRTHQEFLLSSLKRLEESSIVPSGTVPSDQAVGSIGSPARSNTITPTLPTLIIRQPRRVLNLAVSDVLIEIGRMVREGELGDELERCWTGHVAGR